MINPIPSSHKLNPKSIPLHLRLSASICGSLPFLFFNLLFPNIALTQEICTRQLTPAIDAIVNRSEFLRARWGILIQTVAGGNILYRRDSEKYFIPASTVKLFTTATALQKVGTQFRFRTAIYGDSQQNLYVVGRGDPSLTENQLRDLARQLKRQGIQQVNQLIGDDSYFQGSSVNLNWEWEDVQAGYGAPVNSLIFNQNSIELVLSPQSLGQSLKVTFAEAQETQNWQVENQSVTVRHNEPEFVEVEREFNKPIIRVKGQLRVGSESESVYVAVENPAHYFLQQFQRILASEGITVQQIAVTLIPQNLTQELARIDSPIFAEFIQETNLESNNIYAEVLLRLIGAQGRGSGKIDERGLNELTLTLGQLGVNSEGYRLVDGSGLSRHNLVSPEAVVQLLRSMANSPFALIYRASLPVAGVSGTLENRLRNTAAQGLVQAKTGTLSGVSALSGYAELSNYEPIVFSIMVNQSMLSVSELRKAIDEIVVLMTQLKQC